MRPKHVFLVDNYDSFTFNLVHMLEQLDAEVTVRRNDDFDLDEVDAYEHVLISPGPGIPEDSGLSMALVERYGPKKSILGVCLGMQVILRQAGMEMTNMPRVQHGMQDEIQLTDSSLLFAGLPLTLRVGRYHSWAFKPEEVSDPYRVTATGSDGWVMAVEHVHLSLFGVQFHPESIMTEMGIHMMRNWLAS